jgi:DNA invertase Pin-like site-specific DNA recombinase
MVSVAAAQYLRMSTEHQQYSFANQTTRIQQYADIKGFFIVHTYSDAARSGLVLKRRSGLLQLLRDVMSGTAAFKVILVYDVSRWGRFQDSDEAAHYEFLCKSAGVPVHYCAEPFPNDGTLLSSLSKALKRTMAAEYSRELGVKVLDGQKRLARQGFKQGGVPGYGLRRMLVSADRQPKQQLASGERKSIATDRVILVPGPSQELHSVREIYRMLISERRTVYAIACELNREGVKYIGDSKWDYLAVYNILTHPKYAGCHVFGRTSSKLCTPTLRLPKSEWTLTPRAFEPVIKQTTFDEAQRILHERTVNKSDQELLDNLRSLLAKKERLSLQIIKDAPNAVSPSTYRKRFGSLLRAYELIGYGRAADFGAIDLRRRTQAMRENLIAQIQAIFPNQISTVRRGGRWRSRLRLRNRGISVLIARPFRPWKATIRWIVDPVRKERNFVTLLARLNVSKDAFQDFHILPNIDHRKRFSIGLRDAWLDRGECLSELSQFCEVMDRVNSASRTAR